METATIQPQRSFLEKAITRQGTVLAVHHWEPAGICEIEIQLPRVNMESWTSPPHIKCRVAAFTYRDYTPARWNSKFNTCSIFVDIAHEGAGSTWAKNLRENDPFFYVGVDGTRQKVREGDHLVFLGDQSAMGHFSGLQQLAAPGNWISGIITIADTAHHALFRQRFPELPLETVSTLSLLRKQVEKMPLQPGWQFYVVGNSYAVVDIRQLLKERGISPRNIHAQGFWK